MNSEKEETLADIIREKRGMAAEIRANLSNVLARREDQLLEADSLDREADRIEAAAKRECATAEKSSAVGSAAAMREAVHAVYNSLCDHEIIYPKERWRLIEIFDAALAKPPRNCDRFGGDKDKLIEACLRERGLLVTENFRDVFADWLLAPATEGGAS